jgi:HlyD family secretion protein
VLWVLADGAPKPVRVQVGITDGRSTEVSGGPLAAGDRVITGTTGGSAGERRPTFGRFL